METPIIKKAIPMRFLKARNLRLRDNLTEDEQAALQDYAPRAMTPAEIAAVEAEGAEKDAADAAALPLRLNAYLDSKRYEIEQAGIVVAGISIMTRDRDKLLINGKITEVMVLGLPDAHLFNFTLNGEEITMSVGQIKAVGVAIAQHVQRCIDAASAVRPTIADGTLTTEEDVDAALQLALNALSAA